MIVNHAGYKAKRHFDPTWFNVGGSDDIKEELAGLPDFNHGNPEVLDFFINNIEDDITLVIIKITGQLIFLNF
jgi:alpha-amylase